MYILTRVGGRHRARQPNWDGTFRSKPHFSGSRLKSPSLWVDGKHSAFQMVVCSAFLLGKCNHFVFVVNDWPTFMNRVTSAPVSTFMTETYSSSQHLRRWVITPVKQVCVFLHQWEFEVLKIEAGPTDSRV